MPERTPNRTFRTIALTPAGEQAIAHLPALTWEQVLRRGKAGSCNPCELGPKK
jgi:hypothetical protein